MTLDEAIKEFTEWAKNNRDEMNYWLGQINECDEESPLSYADCGGFARDKEASAERYEQLAEWLTELKELKNSIGAIKLSNMNEALELIREYKAENIAQKKMIAEYKRILKMAVDDISTMPCNNDTHRPESCYICVKHGNCSYADSFKWCKADEALKLIGEANEEQRTFTETE